MSEICRDGRWFGPTHRNLRIHLLTRSRETDRATLRPAVRCVGHIDREQYALAKVAGWCRRPDDTR